MPEDSGDQRLYLEAEPAPREMAEERTSLAAPVAKSEAVRLAYQLLLGREPEDEGILVRQSNFSDIYDLRNRFMIGDEFQNYQRYIQMAELLYTREEATVTADTTRFDELLAFEPDLEAQIREIINLESVGSDRVRSEYVSFHRQRFFDQIRAVVAIRRKIMGGIPRLRVLEVGASPVTRMYAQVLNDIDLYTADLPSEQTPADIASRYGSIEHYFINLDVAALADNYPRLVEQPFHIVLFCEVIEHVLASPEEMLGDLLKLLAPGGVLIVSTPNAMSGRRLFDIAIGRKGDSVYRRNARELHQHHHIHVREYTLKELRDACSACGAKILLQAVKNYYSRRGKDLVATKYVSAGEVQVLLVTR
jgi:2-polyprenyl-3-methyl-5-hydroxy-6-metoxy-1,4-benzoquinol methylase